MSAWNFPGLPYGHEVNMKGRKGDTLGYQLAFCIQPYLNLEGFYMYVVQYILHFNSSQLEEVCLLKDSQYNTSSGTHFHLLPTGSPHADLDASRDWSS